MIGHGIDLVEIQRIKKIVERKPHFLTRYFSEKEKTYFDTKLQNAYQSIAANFAAKEAVSKALGTGIRGFDLRDIEILRNHLGAPYILLSGNAKTLSETLGISQWYISLSHSENYAIASVIAT